MKVNPDGPVAPTDYLRVESNPAASSNRRSSGSPVQSPTDSVSLSGDVQFVNQAAQAAQSSADVRPDVVARAKAMLDRGEVGTDLQSLAGKMVDSLLGAP